MKCLEQLENIYHCICLYPPYVSQPLHAFMYLCICVCALARACGFQCECARACRVGGGWCTDLLCVCSCVTVSVCRTCALCTAVGGVRAVSYQRGTSQIIH